MSYLESLLTMVGKVPRDPKKIGMALKDGVFSEEDLMRIAIRAVSMRSFKIERRKKI